MKKENENSYVAVMIEKKAILRHELKKKKLLCPLNVRKMRKYKKPLWLVIEKKCKSTTND